MSTRILKLVIKGFKSFANKTEFPFTNNFNIIIGPNGSGKSNILDALCFVLGKSSSKELRAEKASNLIFNGGTSKRAASEALVSIHLDNKDRVFPIEDDVVRVARIVKSDGRGIYKINDNVVTRRDMVDLLSRAMINPDGYNILLQGDVTRFVEMSALERRKLIEEVAGLGIYEEKKEKAMSELSKVDSKLKEAELILKEKEKYLEELKDDYDNAKKYLELEKYINDLKATILKLQIDKIEVKKSSSDNLISGHENKINEIEKEVEKLNQTRNELLNKIKEISTKIESNTGSSNDSLEARIEEHSTNLSNKKVRLESLKSEISKNYSRKQEIEKNLKDTSSKVDMMLKDITGLEKQKKTLVSEKENIQKLLDNLKEKNSLNDLDTKEKEIEKIDNDIENLNTEVQELRGKQQEALRSKDRLEVELDALEGQLRKIRQLEDEEKDKITEIKALKEKYKKVTVNLNKDLSEDSAISAQLSNARRKQLDLSQEVSKMQAKTMMQREKLSTNNAVKVILNSKDSINGIYGTVGELGKSSKKYSIALEVASGARLFSIVVEDDSVASKCINILRDKKVGVANFLPLNKIKSRPIDVDKKILDMSKVHGLAKNLVKFNAQFSKVFDYVFGNTIVVEDLQTARSLMGKGLRIVTLEGDLVEASGAMQGGYRKATGVSFVDSDTEKEVDKLQKEVDNYNKIVQTLEKKKYNIEEKIAKMRNEKAEYEGEIIKLEKSLSLNEDELDLSSDKNKIITNKIKEIETNLEGLNSEISQKMRALTELKMQRQEKREEIVSARDPALLAELNSYQQKIDSIKDQISNLDVRISTLKSQKENVFDKEINSMSDINKNLEKESVTFEKEKEDLEKSIEELTKIVTKLKEEEKSVYSQFKELFDQRSKLDNDSEEIAKKISDLLEKRREHEKEISSISLESAQIRAKYDTLKEQLAEFKDYTLLDMSETAAKKALNESEVKFVELGNVNLKALEIYDKVKNEFEKLVNKEEELSREKNEVLLMMNEIETKKKEMFLSTFGELNDKFLDKFKALSYKPAQAMLKLTEPESPFDGGVEVKVKIEGKRFMDIRGLSGGEKTMTALAFLFSVQELSSAPFYILDEVDAALDKKNSEQLGRLIADYAKETQYVVISHNDNVIREGDAVYGISMNKQGISSSVSLKFDE